VVVEWQDRVEELLAATERDLVDAVAGDSLCAIGRRGERIDGVKYLEGRAAALRALRRELRGVPVREALVSLLTEWEAQHALAVEKGMGPDWVSYRAGGSDGLKELSESAAGG
jgi:hypothetical protein